MIALLLLTLVAPAPTFAQRDLALLHDSLQRIDDPTLLRGMIAQRSDKQARQSPEVLTERGLIGLRLYELTQSRPDGKRAESAFKEAIKRAPEFGWAHYGLGKILAEGPGSNPWSGRFLDGIVMDDALQRALGNDQPTRARKAFLEAITASPPVPHAASELARLSTQRWNQETLERSKDALARLNDSGNGNAESWLAYASVQLELGAVDDAVTSIQRAVDYGVDRALGARTLATILFESDNREKEGAAAWFESVAHANAEGIELLFSDIIALLHKPQIERWKTMSLEEKRTMLREFWDMRAALGGVTVAERMAEHYRRLGVARKRFWRSARFGAPTGNQLMLRTFGERPYDDRGLIFIRHGQPQQRLRSTGPSDPRESWLYQNIDGRPAMLHFAAMQSGSDFDLVHTLPCDADYVDPRRGNDPNLQRIMGCDALNIMAASAAYREQAWDYVNTDSDRPNFTKDLPFYFDLYTFRGVEGRTNVVAAVAVPVEKLQKSEAANNPAYRVDLSLILVDTAARKVIRQDDTIALATTRAFRNDDLFRMHVEVAVPPSSTTLQRVIVSDPSEPGIGQLYGGPFPIPDYSPGKLMMSDIVLAEPKVEGKWKRGNVALALVPTGRFKGGSFKVFYELYNIAKNTAYSTEIEIEPIQRSTGQRIKELFGSKSRISLKFDGVAVDVDNGALQELRQVEAPLPVGRYRMRITVRTADGQIVKGERIFAVPEE